MQNEANEKTVSETTKSEPEVRERPPSESSKEVTAQAASKEESLELSPVLGELDPLTEIEMANLYACEEVISGGWNTFVQVGLALAQIRKERLYRGKYNNFDDYCREKWQYSRIYAHYLISTAQLFTYLLTNCEQQKPDHESQLRPLVGLTPDQAKSAWERAVQKANGARITARMVKAAVQSLDLSPGTPLPRPMKRHNQREHLKRVEESVGQLLLLLSQKAEYHVLVERVEALHGQIRALIPKPTRKPSS